VCAEEKSTAALSGGGAPFAVKLSRPGPERGKQGLCRVEFTEARERFDLVRQETVERRFFHAMG
jgi:hypothetical protein